MICTLLLTTLRKVYGKEMICKRRLLIIAGVLVVVIVVLLYVRNKYSFIGEYCGWFTPNPKECFYGLTCEYPPHEIDALGTCVLKSQL